jgi:hypothetical protein
MRNTVTEMRLIAKRILLFISVVALVIFTTGAAAEEEENVSVRVNAPEFVSGRFDVTIDIHDVVDLDNGQFDLSFDPDVVDVSDVYDGEIDGTTMPIGMWNLAEEGRICVVFNMAGVDAVSGSGCVAKIIFEVVGSDGDTSALEISDGELCGSISHDSQIYRNSETKELNADWSGDEVTVGDSGTVETGKTASTPVQTATPRSTSSSLDSDAGSVTASTPGAEHASGAKVPVGTSEKDEPDGWGVLAEHNFIEIYSFIGLLAFIYALTLLK